MENKISTNPNSAEPQHQPALDMALLGAFSRLAKSAATKASFFSPREIAKRLEKERQASEVAHQLIAGMFNDEGAPFYASLMRNYGREVIMSAMSRPCWNYCLVTEGEATTTIITPSIVALYVLPPEWFDTLWAMIPDAHCRDRVSPRNLPIKINIERIAKLGIGVKTVDPMFALCSTMPKNIESEWGRRMALVFERAGAPSVEQAHAAEIQLGSHPSKLAEFKALMERAVLSNDVAVAQAPRRKTMSL